MSDPAGGRIVALVRLGDAQVDELASVADTQLLLAATPLPYQVRHSPQDGLEPAFARLERHHVLHPTLAAMRKVVDLMKHDVAFADVHPIVSMASLLLSRGPAKRRVMIAWHEDRDYDVTFVDPPFELSESVIVPEEEVMRVLREYLDRLGATPPP